MGQTTISYVKVLYELGMELSVIQEAERILNDVPQIQGVLGNPTISREAKDRAISRIFPKEIQNFIKVVNVHGKTALLQEIFQGYEEYRKKCQEIMTARLIYVTKPTQKQMDEMKQFLCNHFGKKQVLLELIEDPSLLGGFILQADDHEYDWSLRARYQRLGEKLMRR